MAAKIPIQSFRLKNFKAVRDSGVVRFSPFTVFIGNNGVGKSSLIEGLETFQTIVAEGLDAALARWLGLEHILYKGTRHTDRIMKSGRLATENPLQFTVQGWLGGRPAHVRMYIGFREGKEDEVWIEYERYKERGEKQYERDGNELSRMLPNQVTRIDDEESILGYLRSVYTHIDRWQFVLLDPAGMGYPHATKRTRGRVKLGRGGSNVAEYLLDIRSRDQDAFDGIIETLSYVLPYAEDVQPTVTREIERSAYLQLAEAGFKDKLPGWLLSTGTLRILAILALLRDPDPPPLIVIEEIENGLDPRTINLIVSEVRSIVEEGKTQVIATSHSPYLLDLLDLDHLILAERADDGVVFTRPGDQEALQEWARDFAPGQLYTMGRLSRRNV